MAQLRHDILFMLRKFFWLVYNFYVKKKFFSYVKRMWDPEAEIPIKNSYEHGIGSNDK